MRRTTAAGICVALLSKFCTDAAQIPLQPVESTSTGASAGDSWQLDVPPSVNATAHLVFDTVSSFLQHWPNTRYRNGHNLVPGVVPVGTLLYHGRGDSNVPTIPEWTATDPEHSYLFCRGTTDAGCWHLTIVTVRPLQVLYFDGSSAAKMRDGPMDSQDVVGWGEVLPDRFFSERERIVDLCNWGKPLGIDGYVRMEMDFEIMLCDFTAGVEVVSMANLASQGRGPPRPKEMEDPISPMSAFASAGFEIIHSGSWHNHYPGDRRIKLDLTRLISFYDTALVPSLVAPRFKQERWDHRLLGISPADVAAVMARLDAAFREPPSPGSGVDWDTLFKVVVDRYDDRLEMVRYVLNSTADDALATAKSAMAQFRVMLTPYILRTAVPADNDTAWTMPVFAMCATTHTGHIRRSVLTFTDSELLLLDAVEQTNREICRVIVSVWAEGVAAGLDDALLVADPVPVDGGALTRKWYAAVDGLMLWLDWSVWVKCRPACGFEEICYLPTWPFMTGPGGGGGGGGGRRPGGGRGDPPSGPPPGGPPDLHAHPDLLMEDADDYLRPQPRCVRRIEPFSF